MSKVIRIQFELTPEKFEEIEALMIECGIETKKAFFSNAVTLFKWALNQTRAGNVIASVDEKHGKYRELHMPVLDVQHKRPAEPEPAHGNATRSM